MKTNKITALVSVLAISSSVSHAEIFLKDSFIVGYGDVTKGEYKNSALKDDQNIRVAGGSIIGVSSQDSWVGSSALPMLTLDGLLSPSVTGEGGALSFRGEADDGKRVFGRKIKRYKGSEVLYFSGTLSADVLDDNALSLIAYSSWNSNVDQIALHVMDNYDFKGLAFGFKGNGANGMSLIVRYCNSEKKYVDTVLTENISAGMSYTVVGKINWDTGVSGSDPFTVWVNPEGSENPENGIALEGVLGNKGTIEAVYVMQKNYGLDLGQTVVMDEFRLGSSYEDLK